MKAQRLLILTQLKHAQALQAAANTANEKIDSLAKSISFISSNGYADISLDGTSLKCNTNDGSIHRNNFIDRHVEEKITQAIYAEFIKSITALQTSDRDKQLVKAFLDSDNDTLIMYLVAFQKNSPLPNPLTQLKGALHSAEEKLSLAEQERKAHQLALQSATVRAQHELTERKENKKKQLIDILAAIPDKSTASIPAQNCSKSMKKFLTKAIKDNDFSNLMQKWNLVCDEESKMGKQVATVNNTFSDAFAKQYYTAIGPLSDTKSLLETQNNKAITLNDEINKLKLLRDDAVNCLQTERKEQADEKFLATLKELGFQFQESDKLEEYEQKQFQENVKKGNKSAEGAGSQASTLKQAPSQGMFNRPAASSEHKLSATATSKVQFSGETVDAEINSLIKKLHIHSLDQLDLSDGIFEKYKININDLSSPVIVVLLKQTVDNYIKLVEQFLATSTHADGGAVANNKLDPTRARTTIMQKVLAQYRGLSLGLSANNSGIGNPAYSQYLLMQDLGSPLDQAATAVKTAENAASSNSTSLSKVKSFFGFETSISKIFLIKKAESATVTKLVAMFKEKNKEVIEVGIETDAEIKAARDTRKRDASLQLGKRGMPK